MKIYSLIFTLLLGLGLGYFISEARHNRKLQDEDIRRIIIDRGITVNPTIGGVVQNAIEKNEGEEMTATLCRIIRKDRLEYYLEKLHAAGQPFEIVESDLVKNINE